MRFRKAAKALCALLIVYALQRFVRVRVSEYLSDSRLQSRPTMRLSVDVGTQAKLLCPVRSEDLRSLLWTRVESSGSYALIGNYSSLVVPDRRVTVNATWLPDSDMYHLWLTIVNVRKEDEGTYLCHNRFFNWTFMQVDVEVREKSDRQRY